MKQSYSDIVDRISDDSNLWWDENGVPRYGEFSPRLVANIYASEVALLKIACQNCSQQFLVAISILTLIEGDSLIAKIRDRTLEYGDPPNVSCCPAGPTMSSIPLKVIQFWKYDSDKLEMVRLPEHEVDVIPKWAIH